METAVGHVTSRGNARAAIFHDDFDYQAHLAMLARVVVERRWQCHAFCLMPNHVHLLLETPLFDLPKGMQLLNGRYARRFNARWERTGHLFEGPYHLEPVERDEHVLEAARYIVLNPVRAGLCADPAEWTWSSYRTTAGIGEGHSWVTTSLVLSLAGGTAGFRAFVAASLPRRQQQPA